MPLRSRLLFPFAALVALGIPALASGDPAPAPATSPSPAAAGSAAPSGNPSPSATVTPPLRGDPTRGKGLFADNCATCHGDKGEGGYGPSLKGASSSWVVQNVRHPSPGMPKLPLGDQEVADIAAFVSTL
ncbi:MAG: cytochrome c [Candidatus Eremiobacteraeota bacterium]|nr:cytochrome c [Candidatus Eremiobacteraeota bacterium]